ncbi:hypothetical protein F7725_019090 [Dissostichus mawsoni]|uniref:Uncharacterized protein n=1 Tax=Dissostichus mawsoni TaxID=36200 RepID=A0A7J5XUB8_DISMA|nr:hypothetical protein F7725_019090 [Dissostichus mawsoni]
MAAGAETGAGTMAAGAGTGVGAMAAGARTGAGTGARAASLDLRLLLLGAFWRLRGPQKPDEYPRTAPGQDQEMGPEPWLLGPELGPEPWLLGPEQRPGSWLCGPVLEPEPLEHGLESWPCIFQKPSGGSADLPRPGNQLLSQGLQATSWRASFSAASLPRLDEASYQHAVTEASRLSGSGSSSRRLA